jgi:3-methylcrotonyl-CoA carboxylase alpha subunit
MIAKLIVHDSDRDSALRRLAATLEDYEIAGVQTNLDLLRAIASNPEFRAGATDTGFIARHPELLAARDDAPTPFSLAAAALHVLHARASAITDAQRTTDDPYSPWAISDGWRPNDIAAQDIVLRSGATTTLLQARGSAESGWALTLPDGTHQLSGHFDDGQLRVRLDDVERRVAAITTGSTLVIFCGGMKQIFELVDPMAPPEGESTAHGSIVAPIPGYIAGVLVTAGQVVKRHQTLIVLEAMKMELPLIAPADGRVAAVRVSQGEMVEEGRELVLFDDPGAI